MDCERFQRDCSEKLMGGIIMANCPKKFWECPKCGSHNEENKKYCYNCGYKTPDSLANTLKGTRSNGRFLSFFEKIFQNPGKKIQRFAIVDFVASIIVGIICACSFSQGRWGGFSLEKAIEYLIAGLAGGYVTAIVIYAFGSFITDTSENKVALARIEMQLKQMNSYFENTNELVEEQKKREDDE